MTTQHLTQTSPSTSPTAAQSRYQTVQVAGLVAPFVDALRRTTNLDAIWAIAFPFDEMAHPTRPTLKLSTAILKAGQAGALEHMRVDSLESARSALARSSHYSDWTEASYAPLLELLDMAIASKQSRLRRF